MTTEWQIASFSGTEGNCVRVADLGDTIGISDSKDPDGPILEFTPAEFVAFLRGAKAGEFDDLI